MTKPQKSHWEGCWKYHPECKKERMKKKYDISDETIESIKQDAEWDKWEKHDEEEMSEWAEYEDEWDARDFL